MKAFDNFELASKLLVSFVAVLSPTSFLASASLSPARSAPTLPFPLAGLPLRGATA